MALRDLRLAELESLDRFAFDPRRVEKPWGWELIWAQTERYVGKILFVAAGSRSASSTTSAKDESWYVQAGQAKLELGAVGRGGAERRW